MALSVHTQTRQPSCLLTMPLSSRESCANGTSEVLKCAYGSHPSELFAVYTLSLSYAFSCTDLYGAGRVWRVCAGDGGTRLQKATYRWSVSSLVTADTQSRTLVGYADTHKHSVVRSHAVDKLLPSNAAEQAGNMSSATGRCPFVSLAGHVCVKQHCFTQT